jgi:hypothetical protein
MRKGWWWWTTCGAARPTSSVRCTTMSDIGPEDAPRRSMSGAAWSSVYTHAEVGGAAHALFHGPPPLGEEEELPGGVVEQLDERRGERGDEHHGQGQDGVVLRRGLHGVAPAQLWMAATSTTPLTLSISASTTASRMGMAKKSPAATQPTSAHHFSVSEAAVSSAKSVR